MTSRRLRDRLLDAGLRCEAQVDDSGADHAPYTSRPASQHMLARLARLAYVTWRKSQRD
jgi:hypothetical protein